MGEAKVHTSAARALHPVNIQTTVKHPRLKRGTKTRRRSLVDSSSPSAPLRKIKVTTSHSGRKRDFLKALAVDLVASGGRARVQVRGRKIYFAATLARPEQKSSTAHLKIVRNLRLKLETKFIGKMETKGIGDFFAGGADVEIAKIRPVVRICRTKRENEIFHYCRLLQSFPTANLVGRQMRALVFDEGQIRPFLMGAIGLSSSPYSLSCREEFFGWNLRQDLVDRGLDAVMQLAVCMSWPPYSFLLGGKLMAALALSKTLADEYRNKYKGRVRRGTRLQGLVTICAGGQHCPLFNRIMLRPGGLYRRIGETSGYSTSCFSAETMDRARRVVKSSGRSADERVFGKSMRTIKSALRICDLPYEKIVKNGLKKGIYLGFTSAIAIQNLREGRITSPVSILDDEKAIEYWRRCLVAPRISRQDVMIKMRRFNSRILSLGLQVNR
jgi:hypothetical protein